MYKTWSASGTDHQNVARALEAHLNEYAAQVISVGYAVTDQHYVLAVYRPFDEDERAREADAVTAAENIVHSMQGAP